MSTRTPKQSQALFATLRRLGIDDEQRAELCLEYTNGRSSSTTDLTITEAKELLNALNGTTPKPRTWTPPGGHELDRLRKYLMSLAIQAGMYTHRKGVAVCDVPRLQAWIDQYGKHKGPLNTLTKPQVNDLCRQMEQYTKKEIRKS